MPTGGHWFVLGLQIGEYRTSVFSLLTNRCQRHERFVKLAIASRLLMFLPALLHLALTSLGLVPIHKRNCRQIVEQRLKVLQIFRSDAALSILTFKPLPVFSFAGVDDTDSLWAP